jgi:hypothetical protein
VRRGDLKRIERRGRIAVGTLAYRIGGAMIVEPDRVAQTLLDFWITIHPVIAEYLKDQFGFPERFPVFFRQLIICEMADAAVSKTNIGGIYARKWVSDGQTLVPVAVDFAARTMYETDASREVYLSPSYLFAHENDIVLLSERYGPHLIHRRHGRIIGVGTLYQIEWQSLWRTDFRNRAPRPIPTPD